MQDIYSEIVKALEERKVRTRHSDQPGRFCPKSCRREIFG